MSQQLGDKVLINTSRILGVSAQAVDALIKTIEDLITKFREDSLLKELEKHLKDGQELELRVCKSFVQSDLDKKLSEKHIPHAMLLDKNSGLIVVATRDTDRAAVRDAINELFLEQKSLSRVTMSEMQRLNVNQYIYSVDNLTPAQVKLFQEDAQKNNFIISAQKQENGLYSVSYSQKDYLKAQDAMVDITLLEAGLSGKNKQEKINREINSKDDLLSRLENKQEMFYIASADNPDERMMIDEKGFSHYRGDKLVRSENRTDERFCEMTYFQMMGMVHPVILSKDQYETSPAQREFNIKQASSEPQLTASQLHQLKVEAKARTLMEMKLSLDNGNQPENLSSFFNSECSFSEFFAHEVVNDAHDQEEYDRALESVENMNDSDKKIAIEYIRNAYEEIDKHSTTSRFVDEATLEDNDIQVFIDSHIPDSAKHPDDEISFGELNIS